MGSVPARKLYSSDPMSRQRFGARAYHRITRPTLSSSIAHNGAIRLCAQHPLMSYFAAPTGCATGESHPNLSCVLPSTMAKNSFCSFSVIGPRFPAPI
jgi:hypothetical protein